MKTPMPSRIPLMRDTEPPGDDGDPTVPIPRLTLEELAAESQRRPTPYPAAQIVRECRRSSSKMLAAVAATLGGSGLHPRK